MPFGPDLLFSAADMPGLVLHVEICEDMFVPVPPSAQAALAGATVLANLSGSPITIGRAEDRCWHARPRRAAWRPTSTPRRARGVDHRSGLGRPDDDLRERPVAGRVRAVPAESSARWAGRRPDLLRAERLRMGTFDDNRRHQDALNAFRRIDFQLDPLRRGYRPASSGRAVPVCAQ